VTPVSRRVSRNRPRSPSRSSSLAIFSLLSAATTNLTLVSPKPAMVTGWSIANTSTSPRYVRLYDKATAPVPATDAALIDLRFPIPAGTQAEAQLGTNASWFHSGLGLDITGGPADTDATAVAAGDVSINIFYR
jgi:hypothetical protein